MLNRLAGVFSSFQRHDVRYMVIGGIAAVLHGVPRATFDLDLLIDPSLENSKRLLDALAEQGFGTATMTTPDELARHEITIFKDRVRIDVLTQAPGIDFGQAWGRKVVMEYEGQAFQVVSRQDLIASKKASGRLVDMEDVRLLELGGTPTPD